MKSKINSIVYKPILMVFALSFALVFSAVSQDIPETTEVPAQNVAKDYSPEELQQFVSVNQKIVELQQESQEKMMQSVEEENMDIERFNQLAEAHEKNNMDEATPTEEEVTSFNSIAKKIIEEQDVLNAKIIKLLDEEGIGVEKFEEMITAYQENPEMQEDVHSLLEQN